MTQTQAGFGPNSVPRTLARTSLDVDALVPCLDNLKQSPDIRPLLIARGIRAPVASKYSAGANGAAAAGWSGLGERLSHA
jgi:hypothetical protein